MKLNILFKYAAALGLTIACGTMIVGCTDNFEELNTNKYEVDPDSMPVEAQFIEPSTYV